MLEKLKSAAKVFLILLIPFGWVWWLLQRIASLKAEVARTKAEAELGSTLEKLDEAKNAADKKEAEFRDALDAFERGDRES